MKTFRTAIGSLLYRHLAALVLALVTAALLRLLRPYLFIQIIALIYLLPVMLSTVLWGLTPGILSAFAAFLGFNYFHLEPYRTFQVHETQDLITLMIFLIVAVVTSQLIGQAREGMRMARLREWEATRMYELISALAGLSTAQKIAQVLAKSALEAFHAAQAEVSVVDHAGGA
ncbi:MAG TPA: DUF4118 domain-containing protein, partial [Anaerolineaceae bacterium]